VIAPAHRGRFERYAKGTFFEEGNKCPEFLRHKACVISPSVLQSQSIPTSKLVQHAGEFILTFPGGYHQGYNTGFNCRIIYLLTLGAESVNFACFDMF
jgi:jumonji domain-containing protein 2